MAAAVFPRCVLYARSTAADPTCQVQLRKMHQFVEARRWRLDAEYVDIVSPLSGRGRPQADKLLKAAAEHVFDIVVVTEIARFAPSARVLYKRLQFLESHGVRFVAALESIDTQDETPVRCGEMLARVGRACLGFESVSRSRQ
jgi:DNA invertase Pin-like site-specific DNA recombinase